MDEKGRGVSLLVTACVFVVATAAFTVHKARRRQVRPRRGDVARILGASELSSLDCAAAYQLERGGLSGFQNRWISHGKAVFPILKLTEANLLMVTEWLVREMRAEHVRNNWASECIPVIAMGILVPSRRCVEAYAALHHPEVQERLRQHRDTQSGGRTWGQWAMLPVEVLTGTYAPPVLLRQQ
jgi:hypothetical protein